MKKLIKNWGSFILVWGLVATGFAFVVEYNQALVSETALGVNKTYPLPIGSLRVEKMSFTAVCSSATLTTDTFTDGVASTGTITISSSPVAGFPGAVICINNQCVVDGVNWFHDPLGYSSGTALSIAQAINIATGPMKGVVVATVAASGTVIYTTATSVGFNYVTYTSSQPAMTLSNLVSSNTIGYASGAMTGAVASAVTLNSPFINIPNHGYGVGSEVLYTTNTNRLTGLTSGTTYYTIPVNANSLELSATSTGAVAGLYIIPTTATVAANSYVTKSTYTLTPLTILGSTTSYKWQVSNDGVNWIDYTTTAGGVAVSSVTILSGAYVATGTVNSWDFGYIDYAYVRLNVVAPPTGEVKLSVWGSGNHSNP
jgi:hypothetical protein